MFYAMKTHPTQEWKRLVKITLLLFISLSLIGFLFYDHLKPYENLIKIIEVTATFILITDLVFWYRKAKSGYDFVSRNWIKIIAVFPFAFFFRALSILRVEAMFPAAGFEVVAFFNKMPSWVQTTAKLKEFVEV